MDIVRRGDLQLEKNRNRSMEWMRLPVEDSLSFESFFVAFVFFAVISQFIMYAGSDTLSKPFRPLIVLILAIQVVRRGRIKLPVCNIALVMALYQFTIWFFLYPDGGSLTQYLILILYFMMLFSVAGFPWNRGELQLILYATFLATLVCAIVFFISNDMTDLSEHEFLFMGQHVNRNKNAYAFAIGIILGSLYLTLGKGRNKVIIILIMMFEGYCLLYSQSRGAFFSAFASICIIVLNNIIEMKKNGNPYLVFYCLFFITICVIGYFLIKHSAVSRLVDSENLSGRDEGMEHAVFLFRKAPLFGKIFGNGIMYESDNTEGIGVHFVYLTYLLESGIIGAILIILIFFLTSRNIHGKAQWCLFTLALSRTFFEGMDYYIFIPLILSVCLSNYEWLYDRPCGELFWRKRYLRN